VVVPGAATPAKGGNEISWKSAAKDIGAYPYNSTGIEHGVDTTFAVISHHKSAKLQACRRKPSVS
jgi:hypothetical protein